MRRKTLLLSITILFLTNAMAVGASVPELINYQGRLKDSAGTPLDGVSVVLTFRFYDAETGGTLLLTMVQNSVQVTEGVFNVLIGSGASGAGSETTLADVFQNHQDVWISQEVNADGEMSPRRRIATVPYSFKSGLVETGWLDAYLSTDDWDGDGHDKISAGGDDCDDGDPTVTNGCNVPPVAKHTGGYSGFFAPGFGAVVPIIDGRDCYDPDNDITNSQLIRGISRFRWTYSSWLKSESNPPEVYEETATNAPDGAFDGKHDEGLGYCPYLHPYNESFFVILTVWDQNGASDFDIIMVDVDPI